jgi:hypothetical protein
MKMDLYYANIWKREHQTNMTSLWCKTVPKINLEQTKGNEGSYIYLYPLRDLTQKTFKKASMGVSNK